MTNAIDLHEWIAREIQDYRTSWSVGTFGAIAEFSRESDEPAHIACDDDRYEAVTSKGGIRIDALNLARPVAYETTNKNPDQWSHAVALCLPIADSAMNRRSALTAIGPDVEALREEDRHAFLFDLGLGADQVDFCVRASEPDLLQALRAGVGRSVFDTQNPAMPAILRHSPHRVAITRVARAEVYQAIPAPDKRSPDGPHTHLLPKLLRSGRTHAATNPIPDDWVPCAHLYPAHPTKDAMGHGKPFDGKQHEAFQRVLDVFGDAELNDLKKRVALGVSSGGDPTRLATPASRSARATVRIALRQMQAVSGAIPSLTAWKQCHDRMADLVVEDDEQAQHG